MGRKRWIPVAALWALVGATPAMAQEVETLVITAENLTAGAERASAGDVVLPGDVIRYRLTFTNGQPAAVRNIVLDNPVPAGLEYVAGSAAAEAGGVTMEFSIDGGESYSARPMVEQVVEGQARQVPAPASMYTHVRWRLGDWVEPGARVQAEFHARVADSGRSR